MNIPEWLIWAGAVLAACAVFVLLVYVAVFAWLGWTFVKMFDSASRRRWW